MLKVLSCKFLKYLGNFNMLIVEECSEKAVFREWCNRVFDSLQLRKYMGYDDFFFKCSKFDLGCINGTKDIEYVFCF